jgi:hypothetical protein
MHIANCLNFGPQNVGSKTVYLSTSRGHLQSGQTPKKKEWSGIIAGYYPDIAG